ncbi:hypothetical protein PPERSA_03989 [Pseudocohnilembus persalinus]|uniref:Cystatin domain-containing protein n=1 Tax=Pseudocohnilembus persalinus TaxID=266149 RepID=A0A0V0QBL4_PSEPJ|nr:hypothetical protein PPERSA_03989 [Pseudocohnilembus persalinus]|eukprot:KRW99519.1 hypothetical protein PPERSA_03989 [Pseudocohnilembus persalinus]
MNKILSLILIFIFVAFSSSIASGNIKAKNFNPEVNPIDKLALEALLENAAQMDAEMELVSVISCETQIVSGQNYFLTLAFNVNGQVQQYKAEVYVVPWEQNATVMRFELDQEFLQKNQEENSSMDGGINYFNWYENQQKDSIFYQQKYDMVKLINQELQNRELGSNFKVVSAQTQVVSGIKYILTILVDNQEYQVEILSQIWNDVLKITSFKKVQSEEKTESALGNLRKQYRNQQQAFEKNQLIEEDNSDLPIPQKQVGAFKSINFDEEDQIIKNLVLRGIAEKLDIKQDSVKVLSASRRVVNGLLYEINFTYDGIEYTADIQVVPYKQIVNVLHLVQV